MNDLMKVAQNTDKETTLKGLYFFRQLQVKPLNICQFLDNTKANIFKLYCTPRKRLGSVQYTAERNYRNSQYLWINLSGVMHYLCLCL